MRRRARELLPIATFALGGCVASPMTNPGFVDLGPSPPGRTEAGADARVVGMSSAGWAAGGTVRVTPHVGERWAVPVEAGAFPALASGGTSHGNVRVGVRRRLRPWLSLGAGAMGNAAHRDGALGLGGGGDVELAMGSSRGRFGVSATLRPGFSANQLTVSTLWMPVEVAAAWHANERVSLFGSVFAGGGVSFAGPFGWMVGLGGASVGVVVRLGPRRSAPATAEGR